MSECKISKVPMQPKFKLIVNEVCDEKLPYRELIGS